MSASTIPRFLLPRGQLYLRDAHLQHRLTALFLRHASTATPVKPRVLEKPERFNPPSHPARLRRQPRQYPGAPMAEHEREAQKTRKYPHMMPPEGTFLHWFLTNRAIHTWITLSVLVSLAFFTWLTNFLATTPYKDQLPPNNLFLGHPLRFLARYVQVYKLHTEYISAQTAERRKQRVDDVQKRSEYRKAHGMDEGGLFGGWTAKTDAESMGPAFREGGPVPGVQAASPVQVSDAGSEQSPVASSEQAAAEYANLDSKKRPVKKWLGIW